MFPGITVYFIGRGWALFGPDRFADRLPLLTRFKVFDVSRFRGGVKMDLKEGWDNRLDIFRIVRY